MKHFHLVISIEWWNCILMQMFTDWDQQVTQWHCSGSFYFFIIPNWIRIIHVIIWIEIFIFLTRKIFLAHQMIMINIEWRFCFLDQRCIDQGKTLTPCLCSGSSQENSEWFKLSFDLYFFTSSIHSLDCWHICHLCGLN